MFNYLRKNHMKYDTCPITYPRRTARALVTDFFNRRTIRPLSSCIKRVRKRSWINLVSSQWKLNLILVPDNTTRLPDLLQWNTFKVRTSLHPTTTRKCSTAIYHMSWLSSILVSAKTLLYSDKMILYAPKKSSSS